MDPSAHRELGDENVAAFGEQDRGLGRNHLDVGIGFHDLLDAGEGQLVQLVIVGFVLELVDGVLPIGGQDVAIAAHEALVDLQNTICQWNHSTQVWNIAGNSISYVGPCSLIQLLWREPLTCHL